MLNVVKNAVLTLVLLFMLGILSLLLFPPNSFKPPIIRDLTGANGQPVDIESVMPGEQPSLPSALIDAIAANLHSYTEITTALHWGTIGLTPQDIPIHDSWCISVYPPATITLHNQPDLASEDVLLGTETDLIGEPQTRVVDTFLALKREAKWVLYGPGYYCPSKLGT